MTLRRLLLIAAALDPGVWGALSQTAPLLINPSFEADHFTNFPGLVSSNRAMTGWFAVGNVGLNPIADGRSPYADNGAVPQGTQVAFIQSGGLLRQTLAGFIVGGVYQVQYAENACGQCLTPAITVTVGADTVVASHPVFPVGGSNSYHQVVSAPFVAIATSLQISFQNTVAGSGSTNGVSSVALIDNVSISLLSTGSTSQGLAPPGADSKYLDNCSDLGTVWQQISFDDSAWFSGPAQLGYGDGDERTVVGYGPNSNFKYLTTYFRRAFTLSDPNSLAALTVRLLRDDGGIVYINGVEVFRSNMPEGFVNINTFASTTIPNADETRFFPKLIDPAVLVQGTNIIAVEIHQAAYNSSDISFDLDLVAAAAVGPPSIVTQPRNVVTATGGNAYFSVKASGSSPLSYQWQFAGADMPGATNANLVLTNVSAANRGRYSVTVSNPLGSLGSAKALLTLIDLTGDYFQITGLSAANSSAVEHFNVTGDDRGGIAASLGELFVTGDASTARFNLNDLSGATSLGIVYDGLVSDLRSGRVFVLANGSVPLTAPGGTVDTLLEINTLTGGLGSASIALSAPVKLTGCSGCMGGFSGFGRIVLYNGTNAFLIALPSGVVQDLGPVFLPSHMFSENWAYWGVVEYFADANWIVYVRDYQNIVRTRLPDGLTLPVAAFTNLSDMVSFTVSPLLNRWYFHHQYTSQFRSGSETAGYADASLAHEHQVQPPAILAPPRDRFGKLGSDAFLEVIPSGFPLAYQWQFNGFPITDATNRLLSLTNLSAADVGLYNVIVANGSGSITSSVALLNVTISGGAASSVAILTAETSGSWNDDVRNKIQASGLFSQV